MQEMIFLEDGLANCQLLTTNGCFSAVAFSLFLSPVPCNLLPDSLVALTLSSWNQTVRWLQEMDLLGRHCFISQPIVIGASERNL